MAADLSCLPTERPHKPKQRAHLQLCPKPGGQLLRLCPLLLRQNQQVSFLAALLLLAILMLLLLPRLLIVLPQQAAGAAASAAALGRDGRQELRGPGSGRQGQRKPRRALFPPANFRLPTYCLLAAALLHMLPRCAMQAGQGGVAGMPLQQHPGGRQRSPP